MWNGLERAGSEPETDGPPIVLCKSAYQPEFAAINSRVLHFQAHKELTRVIRDYVLHYRSQLVGEGAENFLLLVSVHYVSSVMYPGAITCLYLGGKRY